MYKAKPGLTNSHERINLIFPVLLFDLSPNHKSWKEIVAWNLFLFSTLLSMLCLQHYG